MGQKKVQRTEQLKQPPIAQRATVVDTGFKWSGFPVLLLVPHASNHNPKAMAKEFTNELEEMCERAQMPTIRDMYEATLKMQAAMKN